MNKRVVLSILGLLLILLAGFMAIPLIIALRSDPSSREGLGLALGLFSCLGVGLPLFFYFRKHVTDTSLGTKEGLAITAAGWIILAGMGALPFCIAHPDTISFTDAYFEVIIAVQVRLARTP